MGARVWESLTSNSSIDISSPGWANKVVNSNFNDLRKSDALFAIVNGTPPDEGVMVDIAVAFGQPTFLFRDDFRKSTDSDEYRLDLMIFLGIPADSWNYYYLEEIDCKKKAIYKWLRN